MRRIEYCATLALLLLCGSATACKGQSPSERAVDPALIAVVDSMLPKLEVLAGLKKLRPVALAEQSREELRKYIETRLEQELPEAELDGIRQTYVAFGLIPDTLDIRTLLLDLYQEQVAGYYDPTSDKFYLVRGTPVGLLRPVLAHELVHALQDQHANLDSLISRKRGNDRQSAAQAAIEGHATMVMFAYLAQEASGSPITADALPDISAQLKPALDAQNSQFPIFRRAPRIIRETMVFPYVAGAGFAQKVWVKHAARGFVAPIGELLPQSTEQVLHPQERFLDVLDAPTELRFAESRDAIYENTLGELEISILLTEHLGAGQGYGAGWDGDRYQLVKIEGRNAVVWQTVWDDAAAADRFAELYGRVAQKRRDRAIRIERNTIAGQAGVLVIDAPSGTNTLQFQAPAIRLLP